MIIFGNKFLGNAAYLETNFWEMLHILETSKIILYVAKFSSIWCFNSYKKTVIKARALMYFMYSKHSIYWFIVMVVTTDLYVVL